MFENNFAFCTLRNLQSIKEEHFLAIQASLLAEGSLSLGIPLAGLFVTFACDTQS